MGKTKTPIQKKRPKDVIRKGLPESVPMRWMKGPVVFQLLQSFDMCQERPPIGFYAFDLLQLNGKNLQNLPIEERKAKLEELIKKPPGVIRYWISFTKDIPELLDRAGELWLGGLISKRSGSR
jgi:bifunctional non-homologous end joining protein LigD